jgi:Arc/MetJ-type ribon-helix-helix transcriptional regulator
MQLTDTGESRVNGYLFILERSLKTFLPSDVVRDAVREIESHLRERIAGADGAPNERVALEKILGELGPPLRVAQGYSVERTLDEAVATGRFVSMLRAVTHLAASTVWGFFAAFCLFVGYAIAFAFLAIAILKPIFPDNVGVLYRNGIPVALGAHFPVEPGIEVRGGYWLVLVAVLCGLGVFVATHRAARRFLSRWRERRALARTGRFVA